MISMSAFPVSAIEQLIEVDRVGHTKSIQYHYIEKSDPKMNGSERPIRYTPEAYYERMLPIKTASLSPGVIKSEPREFKQVIRPIFIIGSDPMSIEWLERNKPVLVENQAIGMLVEVNTVDQLKRIGQIGTGLQIAPSSGEQIAQILKIRHYPVLITSEGIEQ